MKENEERTIKIIKKKIERKDDRKTFIKIN